MYDKHINRNKNQLHGLKRNLKLNDYNFTNKNLIEVTSPRQKQNGTRQFFDRKTRVHYVSTTSGYVRREIRYCDNNHLRRYQQLINQNTRYVFNVDTTNSYVQELHIPKLIFNENDRLAFIDKRSLAYKGHKFTSSLNRTI